MMKAQAKLMKCTGHPANTMTCSGIDLKSSKCGREFQLCYCCQRCNGRREKIMNFGAKNGRDVLWKRKGDGTRLGEP